MNLRKGDIGLSKSNSWLGRRIRRYETTPGESATRFNHAFVVVRDGTLLSAEIVEALGQGVVCHKMRKAYYGQSDKVMIYRDNSITDAQRDMVCLKALSMVGMPYGYPELLAHWGDWVLSRIRRRDIVFFRKLCRANRTTICSVVVAEAFAAAGERPWGQPTTVNPDMIDDVCRRDPRYTVLRSSATITSP
jgi:hypothetical protein